MSITDPCRRCGHKRAWLLRPVREHDGVMPVEARVTAGGAVELVGWYEAAVCAGCGWAQFWAHDYAPSGAAAPIPACLECDAVSGWTIAEASDVLSAHATTSISIHLAPRKQPTARFLTVDWTGVLAVRICAQCAAASWFCRPDLASAANLDEPPPSPRTCRRCQSPQISSQLEDWSAGGSDIRDLARHRAIAAGHGAGLFRLLGKHMGRFELDVCRHCFSVEWHGVELSAMRENARLGVSRLERGASEGDSGPYR